MIKLFGHSQILKHDEIIAVERDGAVVYVEGRPTYPKPERFQIRANIQPVNGRDLLIVPEGDRFKEQYWIYVDNCQFAVQDGLNVEAKPTRLLVNDMISRLGVNYQTQSVEDWGSYSRARIMRIDVGPQRTP